MTDREQNRILHPHREGLFAAAIAAVLIAIWMILNNGAMPGWTLVFLPIVVYIGARRASERWWGRYD